VNGDDALIGKEVVLAEGTLPPSQGYLHTGDLIK
jgi:hypothetical protein